MMRYEGNRGGERRELESGMEEWMAMEERLEEWCVKCEVSEVWVPQVSRGSLGLNSSKVGHINFL